MEMILSIMNMLTKCFEAYTETLMEMEIEFSTQRCFAYKKTPDPNDEVQVFVVS